MNTFKWCGYNWKSEMEGGRIINPSVPWCWYSMDQISMVEDNTIELNIKWNPRIVRYYDGRVFHPVYECALMRSAENFDFGIYSCEVMVPQGYYLWPSFWLTGEGNWPPEIDIMEGWSNKDCWLQWFKWDTTNNVHYNNELMQHEHVKSKGISIFKQLKNPSTNFIKYECEWLPDRITFKANGKTVREVTGHVCDKVYKNLEHPEKGYLMNVVFNMFCDDPGSYAVAQVTPMKIRNFKYVKSNNY